MGAERNVLAPLVEKGTMLPSRGAQLFRAARDLRSRDGKFLDFEVFGQTAGVQDPELGLSVGIIFISSDQLDKGDVIRRGDEVFVNWEVDENGLLRCEMASAIN